MLVSRFEQDNMRYAFEPPIEVGDVRVSTIHELAAIALIGNNASDEDIVASMRKFTVTLRSGISDRVEAYNIFLEGKHMVSGAQIAPGMPTWNSATPVRGGIPDITLSSRSRARLNQQLDEIDRARMSVRGNDYIVYPPGSKSRS